MWAIYSSILAGCGMIEVKIANLDDFIFKADTIHLGVT